MSIFSKEPVTTVEESILTKLQTMDPKYRSRYDSLRENLRNSVLNECVKHPRAGSHRADPETVDSIEMATIRLSAYLKQGQEYPWNGMGFTSQEAASHIDNIKEMTVTNSSSWLGERDDRINKQAAAAAVREAKRAASPSYERYDDQLTGNEPAHG